MRLIIQPDLSGISEWTANYIAATINKFAPTVNRPFVLGLPTGMILPFLRTFLAAS